MSWGTCYAGSNNIHFSEPPLMSDGRNYASWAPEAVINEDIKTTAGIKTNWEYRQYLQKNASDIMKNNSMESCYALGISAKTVSNDKHNGTPFIFGNIVDERKPAYGYENSDLKNTYMSREKLNARVFAPSINTIEFN